MIFSATSLFSALIVASLALGPFSSNRKTQVAGQDNTQAPATKTLPAENDTGQTPAWADPPPPAKSGADVSAQELANQIDDPAAPVTSIQFRDILLPKVSGTNGAVNMWQLQPVLPIGPFHKFPVVQLMKMTLPLVISTPGVPPPFGCIGCPPVAEGTTGLGDLQVFDLFTFKQSWGRWGIGPTLRFPTANAPRLGAGKWQAGPSFALIYTGIKNLTVGAILQNPVSFAGSPNRPNVNEMIITPTFTFNLKEGWFVGISDFNWSFNWESGGEATFPLGAQVGKVVRIGKQLSASR